MTTALQHLSPRAGVTPAHHASLSLPALYDEADGTAILSLMAEQPEPTIKVDGLVKRFKGRPILDGVTFSVPAGEVFGLVGLNGAGKTTILRILATFLAADEGQATVAGISLANDPEAVRASIGYLPDFFGLYDRLSVREHLEFYAGIHDVPGPRRRRLAEELLELVGLASQGACDVAALSRGQRQRLGLGQALVHDPAVLLLDEPCSGLDPLAQIEVRELIKELRKTGKTILVSSHDLAALNDICSRIGLIDGGRMAMVGPVAEFRTKSDDLAMLLEHMKASAAGPTP